MTTAEFLSHVRDLGINLWLDGDDLHYSAPKGALTQDLRAELVERKAEILVFLRKTQAVALPSQADEAKPELTKTFVAPRTPTEETLAEIWAQVLGVEQVGIHDNFFELGGDSLLGMQVINSANQAGLRFVPRQLLEHQTIAELAAVEGTVVVQAEQGVITGPVPLLPIQHIVLRDHSADPDHSDSIIHLLEAQQTLDPVLVEKVVRQLLVHHDALRLRFVRKGSGWHQFIAAPDEEVPFSCIDLSVLPEKHQSPAIEAASVELQACMDLSRSPLQIALFDLGADRPSRLLIIVHHLVTDGYSQQILLHDLETAYRRLSRGEETQLPTKTTSYKHWADRLRGYATSSNIRQELVYWCWLAESCRQISCLPVDYPEGVNTQASLRHLRLSLSVEETSVLLREIPKYDARIIDALLTALGETFARWSGERLLSVMFVSHGREALFADVDLSRTIGYFATHHPLFLDLRQASNLADVLRLVREQIW